MIRDVSWAAYYYDFWRSCDTEDCSNDAENTDLITEINYILLYLHLFTFMHLADAFIQSDLHCIQGTVSTFYQLLLSLGIEPMILALLAVELQESCI